MCLIILGLRALLGQQNLIWQLPIIWRIQPYDLSENGRDEQTANLSPVQSASY